MNCHQSTKFEIMKTALSLFSQNGYTKTGIRQIADGASVSLGLVNHYFASKKNLGALAVSLFWFFMNKQTEKRVDMEDEPLVYDAVVTRGLNRFMLTGKFRQFYLDSLNEDIFFDSLSSRLDVTVQILEKKYPFPSDRDIVLLYNRYVPYNMEKTLVLKKEEGMFQSIPCDDVPFYICLSALERFVPREDIVAADAAAREIVPKMLAEMPKFPPDELIGQFIG